MTTHIKGLLFDKDGTLFDFHTTWGAWASGFFLEMAHGDLDRAAKYGNTLGYDYAAKAFTRTSPIIASTPDVLLKALMPLVPDWSEAELREHMYKTTAEAPQAEAVPLVPLLRGFRDKNMKLGVSTNDAEEPALAHLGSAGIIEMFDFIAGFDSGFGSKPEPGMQFGFCKAVGLDPEQVAMVGDSTHDLSAGRAAGMHTIGVLTGIANEEELRGHADVILPDIGAIPAYLG